MKIEVKKIKEAEVTIPQDNIEDIERDMKSYYGLTLKREHTLEVLKRNESVLGSVISGIFDTAEREHFASVLAEYVTNEEHWQWPCNGDSDEVSKKFYKDFKEGCDKKGIEWRA